MIHLLQARVPLLIYFTVTVMSAGGRVALLNSNRTECDSMMLSLDDNFSFDQSLEMWLVFVRFYVTIQLKSYEQYDNIASNTCSENAVFTLNNQLSGFVSSDTTSDNLRDFG